MTLGAYCKYLSGADFKRSPGGEVPGVFQFVARRMCPGRRRNLASSSRLLAFRAPQIALLIQTESAVCFARGCLTTWLRHGTVQNHHAHDIHLPRRCLSHADLVHANKFCAAHVATSVSSPLRAFHLAKISFHLPKISFRLPETAGCVHQMVRTEGSNSFTHISVVAAVHKQPFRIPGIYIYIYIHSTTNVLLIVPLYNRAANQGSA